MLANPSRRFLVLILSAMAALSGCSSNEAGESNAPSEAIDCKTETSTLVSSGVDGNILVDETSIYWRSPDYNIFSEEST